MPLAKVQFGCRFRAMHILVPCVIFLLKVIHGFLGALWKSVDFISGALDEAAEAGRNCH